VPDQDKIELLVAAVRRARDAKQPLRIVGGGSKSFLGREPTGEPLECAGHAGLVGYDPTELVVTARGGTRLAELQAALAAEGQMLPFEPPAFGATATIGGTVACGLSGPCRPYAGAARDYVLGTRVLSGNGEVLRFGGEVMKNVAGYDVSRLMCGAFGTLGVLLDVSLKVLPRPAAELSLRFDLAPAAAIEAMNRWAARPLPLSGAAHDGAVLLLRLSGAEAAIAAARASLGGEELADGQRWWHELREHRLPFFAGDTPLWRLSVKSTAAPMDLPGDWLIDWGGAQRWLRTPASAEQVRQAARAAGGHATLFRGGDRSGEVYTPLPAAVASLHRRLKSAFDPAGILNPGRLYAGF